MNKKIITNEEKSTIDQLREIRDKIGVEIQNMTFEQLKEYLDKKSTNFPKKVWQK